MGVANWGCAVPYSLFIDVQPTALWNEVRELARAVVGVLMSGCGWAWVGTWISEGVNRCVQLSKCNCIRTSWGSIGVYIVNRGLLVCCVYCMDFTRLYLSKANEDFSVFVHPLTVMNGQPFHGHSPCESRKEFIRYLFTDGRFISCPKFHLYVTLIGMKWMNTNESVLLS